MHHRRIMLLKSLSKKLLVLGFMYYVNPIWATGPGFYTVQGGRHCLARFGPVVFLSNHYQTPIRHFEKEEFNSCQFKWENNDLKSLNICSNFSAHRGSSRNIHPANTLEAFDESLRQGFRGIEFDLHLTKDKQLIVSHDQRLGPATNCERDDLVKNHDLKWIQDHCLIDSSPLIPEMGFMKSQAKNTARIPSLKESLSKLLPDERAERLFLDLKNKETADAEDIARAVKKAMPRCLDRETCKRWEKKLIFLVQNKETIKKLKAAFPDAGIAFEDPNRMMGGIQAPSDPANWDKSCPSNYMSLNLGAIDHVLLKQLGAWKERLPSSGPRADNFIRHVPDWDDFSKLYLLNMSKGRNRKRIVGWTINSEEGLRRLREFTVEDVLTDYNYEDIIRFYMSEMSKTEILKNINKLKNGQQVDCQKKN
jgi:glycerophosphoryl diester phosphodiesterase